MTREITGFSPIYMARSAGFFYLIIIVFGIFGEMFVRSSLIVSGDPAATVGNIAASEGLFRAGFLADSIMFLCDVALAVLFYSLLKPVSKVLALMAMCFRLVQSAVLALNLLFYFAAILIMKGPGYSKTFGTNDGQALTSFFLDLHAHGYDLGLLLFGIHCLLLGYLILKSGFLPRIIGALAMAGGVTYLIGSYTRFLFPDYMEIVAPIYVVAIIAELSMCLWLLIKGVDETKWSERSVAQQS